MTTGDEVSGLRIGVYVDMANIHMNGGLGMRYSTLREFACRGGAEAVRLNVYSTLDRDRASKDPLYRERRERQHWALRDQGYKVIEKPVKRYTDEDTGESTTKANVDLDLAVDALLQSDKLDRVLLATGDGDFVQVVRALQNKGCRVEVVAFDNVSGDLSREADLFFSGYLIPNLLPIPRAERAKELWGQEGGYVRGWCYHFDQQGKFGFIRYLHALDGELWDIDTRTTVSPYRSAYVHRQHLPTSLALARLPSRQIILEFRLEPNPAKAGGFQAVDVQWVNGPKDHQAEALQD